jgi:cell division protein FtsI/penicillin-binding protein 2
VVEATPMQVARAFAGLATGRLPDLRLVGRIGGRELPASPTRPVPIDAAHLQRIRSAMIGVAEDPNGTAHKALGSQILGLELAVKTGSADLTGRRDEDGEYQVRKHTWVAGWLPRERPEAVFVLFVHDTATTSSHGAVHVARQFLEQPEVLAWLEARGVQREESP